jgi:SAM-dependent methyltransferase
MPEQDAYGQEVYDFYQGQNVTEIVEREDGFIGTSGGPAAYFAPFEAWPLAQQEAIHLAHGRLLDIGCGPGRVCLYWQEQGHDAVGIDNSPLAIQTAQLRGVKDARVLSITQVSRKALGIFDTIVMFGNNFGLFGNPDRAKWLLRRFYGLTRANGRLLAESRDIYTRNDPGHLAYHERNRQRGRMAGQIRLRVRYKTLIGPWFDYLMVSPQEMADIVAGTGWHVARLIRVDDEATYTAVLEKI